MGVIVWSQRGREEADLHSHVHTHKAQKMAAGGGTCTWTTFQKDIHTETHNKTRKPAAVKEEEEEKTSPIHKQNAPGSS